MAINTKPGGGGGLVSSAAPPGTQDVNLIEVAGTAVIEGGVAGLLAVGGADADGAAVTANPLLMGGQDALGNLYALLVDTDGRPQDDIDRIGGTDVVATGVAGMMPVAGDVGDNVAASASNPVKLGAVADQVPSAVVDARFVNLITDLERYLRVASKAYDPLVAADLVSVQNTIASDRDPSVVIVNAGAIAASASLPSTAGIEIGNRNFLAVILQLEDVTSVAWEVSNDGVIWSDASGSPVDNLTGVNGYAAGYWTSAAGVTTVFAADWEKIRFRFLRFTVTVPNATNNVTIHIVSGAI